MQLRDAQTSELIAEGTPLEIATAAADFDPADILYDGVGGVDETGRSVFDPEAVRSHRAGEITALQVELDSIQNQPDSPEIRVRRQGLRDTIKERRDRIAAGKAKVPGARKAQADARARVEKRRG